MVIHKIKNYFRAYKMHPKLISIHVPKAAGTSFKGILEYLYGRSLLPIYQNELNKKIWNHERIEISQKYRAIQGHFPATQQLLESFPDAKLISWVRHPLNRLVSYYYYWLQRPGHNNPNHDRFIKEKPSLVEFSSWEFMQGELNSYFQVPIEQFDYIGIVENYEESFKRMSKILGWPTVNQIKSNVGKYPKAQISKSEILEIEKNLKDDIELYQLIVKKFDHGGLS